MSWLARSIANTLRLDDDDDAHDVDANDVVRHQCEYDGRVIDKRRQQHLNDAVSRNHTSIFLHPAESLDLEEVDLEDRPVKSSSYHDSDNNNNVIGDDNGSFEDGGDRNTNNQGRGVKEDLSEFRETLTRQLWGVASFLAPPPPPPPPPPPLPRPRSLNWLESDRKRTELAERSGSGNEEGSDEEMDGQFGQFREFPQSFLEVGMPEEEEEEGDLLADAVGITEEALDFAENTAHHPETWLNFPLLEEEEFDDFEISDLQFKHARAIEHLAPRLAALRRELCPAHMTEGYFWMVYFVLLHSRLDKHDVDLLSTPQLVKARSMWMHELQKQTKPESHWFGRDTFDLEEKNYSPYESFDVASCEDKTPRFMSHTAFLLDSTASQVTSDSEPEKHSHESREIQLIDKTGHEENLTSTTGTELLSGPPHKEPIKEYDEHEDDWLDDDSELEGYTGTAISLVNEEDVSFSDLEEDLDTMPIKSKVLVKD